MHGKQGRLLSLVMALSSGTVFPACAPIPVASDPAAFRQPAEFEPQAAVWLSAEPDDPEFMAVTAEMVTALLPHVPVKVLVRDSDSLSKTRDQLSKLGVDVDAVAFLVDPLARFFMRDQAVFLSNGQGALRVLDLEWSLYGLPGWCRRLYPDDPELAAKCAANVDQAQDGSERSLALAIQAETISSPLFLENAAIEVNGKGVLLISETLALERNPGRTRDELETALLEIPGTKKVIWLGDGLAQDPLERSTITDRYVGMGAGGHTDEFVKFADERTILLAWMDEERVGEHAVNPINHERMSRNYDILARSTDQEGRPFRIIKVELPAPIGREVVLAPGTDQTDAWNELDFPRTEGRKAGDVVIQLASASYLNLLVANGIVLVPSYVEDGTTDKVQQSVARQLEAAFPGRTIQFIHATVLNWQGGGPHCATLSEPRAD